MIAKVQQHDEIEVGQFRISTNVRRALLNNGINPEHASLHELAYLATRIGNDSSAVRKPYSRLPHSDSLVDKPTDASSLVKDITNPAAAVEALEKNRAYEQYFVNWAKHEEQKKEAVIKEKKSEEERERRAKALEKQIEELKKKGIHVSFVDRLALEVTIAAITITGP